MPSEEEIRRHQQDHPTRLVADYLKQKAQLDDDTEQFNLVRQQELRRPRGRCPICGLDLTPGMNCPRCLNLIP